MIELKQGDCLELMKTLPDNSIDLIFCDPPYALGSEVIIKPNGKPDYKKAVDFMNKWDQPDGTFWEKWFCEAKRVLKHGGHCLMFGMDRQLWFNCYYANYAGFTQKQSLYWYFISNFPKASDLSKNLAKNLGENVTEFGGINTAGHDGRKAKLRSGNEKVYEKQEFTTPLAKKYEGIKYSVAPLKQVVENIMVFQKPYKTGSCLHDVLAMENGDDTITCGGVDIEGNRCEYVIESDKQKATSLRPNAINHDVKANVFENLHTKRKVERGNTNGRFPAQTYISSEAGEIIDLQSGVSKSTGGTGRISLDTDTNLGGGNNYFSFGDSGGASRILHKCDYEAGDYDLYHYCPKVSKEERNEGLEGFEEKQKIFNGTSGNSSQDMKGVEQKFSTQPTANNHPTVKPKALLFKILKLFKTPNQQVILDPFMGSGSMGISAVETDFDYIGYELDPEYFKIAEARIANTQSKAEQRLL
jgi:DNA modification methylase